MVPSLDELDVRRKELTAGLCQKWIGRVQLVISKLMEKLLQVCCYLISGRRFLLHVAFIIQIPARLRTHQVYREECSLNVPEAEAHG